MQIVIRLSKTWKQDIDWAYVVAGAFLIAMFALTGYLSIAHYFI